MKKIKKIYVEITNVCNLNCSFCSTVNRKKSFITLKQAETIYSQICRYTEYIYLHVKGEPLLHPQIDQLIDLANKYNLKVNLTTNGTLLREKIEKIANKPNLNKINVSLHCENKKRDYVEEILELRDKYLQNKTVILRLWTLNKKKLNKKSTEIVKKIKSHYDLSPEIVEKIYSESNIKISDNLYIDKEDKFEWPDVTSNFESEGYCHALKTQIAILVDGTVVPCCLDSDGNVPLGNIYKDNFNDIITGTKFGQLKRSFEDRKPIAELCRKCTYKNRFNNNNIQL